MNLERYPGIARFCEYWRHAKMLQQTFGALAEMFDEENDGCIDASKGFVECACRVIIENLDDPGTPIKEWPDSPIKKDNPSFGNWFSAALMLLGLTEKRDVTFSRVISQHHKLVEELGKFRDAAGPISHGKDGFANKLSSHHRRSALFAADMLVTFLHEAYLQKEMNLAAPHEPYERFQATNEQIDQHCTLIPRMDGRGGIQVTVLLPKENKIMLTISASKLLFGIDREAYLQAAGTCKAVSASTGEDA